jgi:hypothetical protein
LFSRKLYLLKSSFIALFESVNIVGEFALFIEKKMKLIFFENFPIFILFCGIPVVQFQNYVQFHIHLFSKNKYVLESSFKALLESAKTNSDFDVFHRKKPLGFLTKKTRFFSGAQNFEDRNNDFFSTKRTSLESYCQHQHDSVIILSKKYIIEDFMSRSIFLTRNA